MGALTAAYLLSGYAASLAEQVVSAAAGMGLQGLSHPGRQRALQVLAGHLAWVWMAMRVLRMRLAPFLPPPLGRGSWMSYRVRSLWLPWAISGYFISLLAYNAVDQLNMLLLPPEDLVSDSIVAQLVRPEESDMIAVGIGSIGPCFTAPVFEEVLYRGFLLPALTRFFPLSVAVPLHSFIFGLHHHSLKGLLPLSALGLVWALAYVASGNLIVPIVIHAMWNARIFLSSLLLA